LGSFAVNVISHSGFFLDDLIELVLLISNALVDKKAGINSLKFVVEFDSLSHESSLQILFFGITSDNIFYFFFLIVSESLGLLNNAFFCLRTSGLQVQLSVNSIVKFFLKIS